jgi:hypothetical protein
MKPAFLLGLVFALFTLVGCEADVEKDSVSSSLTTESSPTEPAESFTLDVGPEDPHHCPYEGGCDGNVHPTSGQLSVDGKACRFDPTTDVTLRMDSTPVSELPVLSWILEVETTDCGTFRLQAPHFKAYPVKGTASFGKSDPSTVTVDIGPMSHVPSKILGQATVDEKSVAFSIYFGDEK